MPWTWLTLSLEVTSASAQTLKNSVPQNELLGDLNYLLKSIKGQIENQEKNKYTVYLYL